MFRIEIAPVPSQALDINRVLQKISYHMCALSAIAGSVSPFNTHRPTIGKRGGRVVCVC